MKVHELIEKLLKLPQDLPVVCEFEACGNVSDVEVKKHCYEADGHGYLEGCAIIRGE